MQGVDNYNKTRALVIAKQKELDDNGREICVGAITNSDGSFHHFIYFGEAKVISNQKIIGEYITKWTVK